MWKLSMHASRILVWIAQLMLFVLPMRGQTADTGAIAGIVSVPSGALMPQAAVVINNEGTGEKRDLATDVEGIFSVQFLPPGNYDLTVSVAGFEPFILNGVPVRITEVSKVTFNSRSAARRNKSRLAQHPLSFKPRTPLSDVSSIETR